MVTKTFECPSCKKAYEIEMEMNRSKARCPDCDVDMVRTLCISGNAFIRPGADGKGFYGVDR